MSDSQNMSDEVRARLRAIPSVNELLAEWPVVKAAGETCDAVVHAAVTAELSAEKYRLSVSALKDAMTTVPSWLVAQLPKTIMLYAERRIQDRINGIRRSLAEADEQTQIGLLQEMKRLRDAQLRIKKKTGREK